MPHVGNELHSVQPRPYRQNTNNPVRRMPALPVSVANDNAHWYSENNNPTFLPRHDRASPNAFTTNHYIRSPPVSPPQPPSIAIQRPPHPPPSPGIVIYESHINDASSSATIAETNNETVSEPDANGVQFISSTQALPTNNTNTNNNNTLNAIYGRHGQSRCPFILRRFSTSNGFQNYYNSIPAAHRTTAYAPHEMLWVRQQNTQELHRRHMMNINSSSNTDPANSTAQASSISHNPNSAFCVSCDVPHGHIGHRRLRPYRPSAVSFHFCGIDINNTFDFVVCAQC